MPAVWLARVVVLSAVGIPTIGLEQSDDIAVAESECRLEWRLPINFWHMVRHDHAINAGLLMNMQALGHVHIAIVRKDFGEGEALPF